MSENTPRDRRVSVARWFLAVSYGLGAPYTAFLEYGQQMLSQRFAIPPELVYVTSALQFACAWAVFVRPLASLAAVALTATTLGAIVLHLKIGAPMTAWAAVFYTAIQIWFWLASRNRSARPG
ncbi:MAG: hypothetical protein IT179_15390 [Acidobacteria bacterium]|nr:hypothetical protein [Acidobacteriota bacterium]